MNSVNIVCHDCAYTGGASVSDGGIVLCPSCTGPDVKIEAPSIPSLDSLVSKGMPGVGLKKSAFVSKKASFSAAVKAAKWAGAGSAAPPVIVTAKGKGSTPAPGLAHLRTQKAKGIRVLQSSGMLSQSYAQVVQEEGEIASALVTIGLPCFVRPCPVTPRHGFVDSRVVTTQGEALGVWHEARQADPQAEMIVMPFIKASHNMVWRPGLLSVGPGHDGATAGHESISIFLQPEYSKAWATLATEAGCNLATSDPFIEAVGLKAHESVVTQIRAGVKGAPTAPDWIPQAMTVLSVTTIDPAHKADPGAMLAWETEAKTLDPLSAVVYNPGGNLGDHWSVHAQLAGVSVVTTFKPQIGQALEPCGSELVPLDPQAIIYGYLGGLLAPSLLTPANRKRAVCAALLGSHHGLRMGGDSGIYLGASVAMMLRLAQAAIWGEARHKDKGIGAHGSKAVSSKLSRDQIYAAILDNWEKGREGLETKGALFLTESWAGGFGGAAWATCSQATCELDRVMLDLITDPTEARAKQVVATLTNVVNLAHNNGWWLNKFTDTNTFNMAADLDPRIAILAGPIWYDSTQAPVEARIALLGKLEGMAPASLHTYGKIGKGKGAKPAPPSAQVIGHMAMPAQQPSKKLAQLPPIPCGGSIAGQVPGKVMSAQAKPVGDGLLHVQLAIGDKGHYASVVISDCPLATQADVAKGPKMASLGGTGTPYGMLVLEGGFLKTVKGLILATVEGEK